MIFLAKLVPKQRLVQRLQPCDWNLQDVCALQCLGCLQLRQLLVVEELDSRHQTGAWKQGLLAEDLACSAHLTEVVGSVR